MGDGAGDGLHIGVGGKAAELLHHRGERERHIGSGIAIGHGEHVELVDVLCLVRDRGGRNGKAGSNGLRNHVGYLRWF